MHKLLTLPPLLIDQSFPIDDDELQLVANAFGEIIYNYLENKKIYLLIPKIFELTLEDFNWDKPGGIRSEIYRSLQKIITEFGSESVIKINIEGINSKFDPPPCTRECKNIFIWSEQIGNINEVHKLLEPTKPFIGIICPYSYGDEVCSHRCWEKSSIEELPYITPSTQNNLESCYYYDLSNYYKKEVSLANAKKNIVFLGGEVQKQKRTSHIIVKFKGERPWVLDTNDDPIPENYLKELLSIIPHDLSYIKFVLIEGKFPHPLFKLNPSHKVFVSKKIKIYLN